MTINELEITKQDFIDLKKDIKNARKWLAEGDLVHADYILGILETNLEMNLKEDKNE